VCKEKPRVPNIGQHLSASAVAHQARPGVSEGSIAGGPQLVSGLQSLRFVRTNQLPKPYSPGTTEDASHELVGIEIGAH
jgi:hypothetical protein